MTITSTTAAGTAASGAAQTASEIGSQGMKREDFMLLLLTQLKHQDPLEPMDDQALMTQFTQLNSLEELQGINHKMTDLAQGVSLTEASSLIGKEVMVSTEQGEEAMGLVSSVSRIGGEVMLRIQGASYPLSSLIHVQDQEA